MLTDDEQRALEMTADLWNHLNQKVIQSGPTQASDTSELATHIHNIQHMIMANAAARAYPEKYRLLGGTISDW